MNVDTVQHEFGLQGLRKSCLYVSTFQDENASYIYLV